MLRRLGHALAFLAAWTLAAAPVAEAQFTRPAASVVRSLPSVVATLRPQDVFATTLYPGNGAAQSITTGVDLSTNGGMLWLKARTAANPHGIVDSQRPSGNPSFPLQRLISNSTAAENGTNINLFGTTGFSFIGNNADLNGGNNHVAWSFRRAAKFFDIVTWTGDGTAGRVIQHTLGIKTGTIIVKRRDAATNWAVWHAATGNAYGFLNATGAFSADNGTFWGNGSSYVEPTATGFTVSNASSTNAAGGTYVAYLIANDPDTTNGIVQCGKMTGDGNGAVTVNLGWRPQWMIWRSINQGQNWVMLDTARGWGTTSAGYTYANATSAEASGDFGTVTSTGFNLINTGIAGDMLYCAIRAATP